MATRMMTFLAVMVMASLSEAQTYRTPTTGGTTFCTDVQNCLPPADLRVRRYMVLPAPLSGHVITDSESSRFSPWTVRASDHEGTWVMTITEAVRAAGVWRPY
jgi:hypothetical protein